MLTPFDSLGPHRLDENHVPVPLDLDSVHVDRAGTDVRVKYSLVWFGFGPRVSTVFLVFNHGGGYPLWFETMVFGGKYNHWQRRCATWEEALTQHEDTLLMVRWRWVWVVLDWWVSVSARR